MYAAESMKLYGHRRVVGLDESDMARFRSLCASEAIGLPPLVDGRWEIGYLRWVPDMVKTRLKGHLPWAVVRWTAHIQVGRRTLHRPIEHPAFPAYYLCELWRTFGLAKPERHLCIVGERDAAKNIVGPRYFNVFAAPRPGCPPQYIDIDREEVVYLDLTDLRASLEIEMPGATRARFDGEGGYRLP